MISSTGEDIYIRLASIIDYLYQEKNSYGAPTKSVIFIVGDGIRPLKYILNDDEIIAFAVAHKVKLEIGTSEFFDYKWMLFEVARYYSYYHRPTFAHHCLYQLALDGICTDIITTNYDLFFDSLWEKNPDFQIRKNPVCRPGEYCWEDYYSYAEEAADKCRYWKIHGSISHVMFKGKCDSIPDHIHRLPRFPISSHYPEFSKHFPGFHPVPFLKYEEITYPKTPFCGHTDLNPRLEPCIDWNINDERHKFTREIDAVKKILQQVDQIAAIVLLGFSAYDNPVNRKDKKNEELAEVLDNIYQSGVVPFFMAVHHDQRQKIYTPEKWFMRKLFKEGCGCAYDKSDEFMKKILDAPYSCKFRFEKAQLEYHINNWCYLSDKEYVYE